MLQSAACERRLVHFLQWYGTSCDEFVLDGKKDAITIESDLMAFIQEKKRLVKEKIMAATISGFPKLIRLLLDMNDVTLNWKKIKRTASSSRRFALDRPLPTTRLES